MQRQASGDVGRQRGGAGSEAGGSHCLLLSRRSPACVLEGVGCAYFLKPLQGGGDEQLCTPQCEKPIKSDEIGFLKRIFFLLRSILKTPKHIKSTE